MTDQAANPQVLLQRATSAHGAGNLVEAERLYRQILSEQPGQPVALYLLGVVALQVGRPDVAADLIGQSLQRQPANAEAHYNLGNAYRRLRRDTDAERCFREAIRLQPDYASAHYNLGIMQHEAGSLEAAERSFEAAVRHAPGLGLAWCSLGMVLDKLGRPDAAVAAYRTGLEATPALAEGHNNLGNLLTNLGRNEEALACYRTALSANPIFVAAYRNLGTRLQASGAKDDAVMPFRRALLIEPGSAENCYNFGTLLQRAETGISWLQRALAIRPKYAAAGYNLGTAYLAKRALEEARRTFLEVVAATPEHAKAWGNLGAVAQKQGELFLAKDLYRKAICLAPAELSALVNMIAVLRDMQDLDGAIKLAQAGLSVDPLSPALMGAHGMAWQAKGDSRAEPILRRAIIAAPDEAPQYLNLSLTQIEKQKICDAEVPLRRAQMIAPDEALVLARLGLYLADLACFDEAFALSTRAVERQPHNPEIHKMLLFFLQYIPGLEIERYLSAYKRFDAEIGGPLRSRWQPHPNCRDPDKRLKIGYVGGSFQRHSSTSFFLPLLQHHDHGKFEIYSYAYHSDRADNLTEQMRGFSDHWVPTFGIGDRELSDRIRADGIDILVDLCGHTKASRLNVFAEKPAPVSFHWLDHGVTTGLTAIDYFLGDPVFTPEGSDGLFSEKIWNLPHTVFPYTPLDKDLPLTPSPVLKNGYVTFGAIARSIKINDQVVRVWSELMMRSPDSHFALFSQSCRDPKIREELIQRFEKCGVERERMTVDFCPRVLDAHAQIDIMLDTIPHCAGVTFCECLYMGMPAVTLRGKPAIGTLGSSMLTQLGHPEWIAETEDDYVRIACDLASDIERLAYLRQTLRQEMERSPLMDGPAFARDFEAACRAMWAKWCAIE
jgi:predicted O-linked N-acetylglucosamine transferase (SPINDLY family)